MFKKILAVCVVLVLGFVILAYLQPTEYEISRRITVDAPPAVVFAQVNDLHEWEAWSPREKIDPAMKRTYEGAAGVGASYLWSGNNNIGEGRMTIIESRPPSVVRIKLDFIKPFKDTSTVELSFQAQGDQTVVRWNMYGQRNFLGKVIGLIVNCDKMIGGQFEKGLAQLKSVVEKH